MAEKSWIGASAGDVIGVLDVGTTKIACLIAVVDREPRLPGAAAPGAVHSRERVIGVGHQRARGIKAGVVTDLDEAEQAVRAAIAQAERMAGVMLKEVRLSVACGRLRSHNFAATIDVESGVVSPADLARLVAGAQSYVERNGRTLLHLNRIAVRLDGAPGSRDPAGMAARTLSADLHGVSADDAPLRNLLLVVERCHLEVASLIPAPLASALGATTDDERRLGVTCVDIGGGTTTMALFAEGRFLYADAVPSGGNHVTYDIARALHTPLAEAERIKALYGTLVSAQSDELELISYPVTGEDESYVQQTTKAELAEIIRPRIQGLINHIRERIDACEVGAYAGRSLVLTGGASQLTGMADFVAAAIGCPVRVARPRPISGLPPMVASPPFTTAAGLLASEASAAAGALGLRTSEGPAPRYLERVGNWLRQGF